MSSEVTLSVVVPTFGRDEVLCETLLLLFELKPSPLEIIVVDQTPSHVPAIEKRLEHFEATSKIKRVRLAKPSIPRAMNCGLSIARGDWVLYVDDDILPDEGLFRAHALAHRETAVEASSSTALIAGRVLQPDQSPLLSGGLSKRELDGFASPRKQLVREFMAGNFSVRNTAARELGGFDENFRGAAYRFEADFSRRLIASKRRILYEPRALIHHIQAQRGGTRSYGAHLRTFRPHHAVGAYYYLLRAPDALIRPDRVIQRLVGSILTRYHTAHPWAVPRTLFAEGLGLVWAFGLLLRGPRLLETS